MDKETFERLKEFLEELVHPETPEEKKARFDYYIGIAKWIAIGVAIIAAWGIASQLISLSPVFPHCQTFSNAPPVCK